jgi:Uncharacterized protein conserved in archaea
MCSVMKALKLTIKLDKNKFHDVVTAIRFNLDIDNSRSKVSLDEDDEFFYINIEADDAVAMRAALGSISRWLIVAVKIKEV